MLGCTHYIYDVEVHVLFYVVLGAAAEAVRPARDAVSNKVSRRSCSYWCSDAQWSGAALHPHFYEARAPARDREAVWSSNE